MKIWNKCLAVHSLYFTVAIVLSLTRTTRAPETMVLYSTWILGVIVHILYAFSLNFSPPFNTICYRLTCLFWCEAVRLKVKPLSILSFTTFPHIVWDKTAKTRKPQSVYAQLPHLGDLECRWHDTSMSMLWIHIYNASLSFSAHKCPQKISVLCNLWKNIVVQMCK